MPQAKSAPPGFVLDAALFVSGVSALEDLAQAHRISVGEALCVMEDHAEEIEKEAIAMRFDGRATEIKATLLLGRLVDHISGVVDAGDISPTTALKAIEIIHKVSGAADKRWVRFRDSQANSNNGQLPQILIYLNSESAPSVIGIGTGPGRIIDAELAGGADASC